jgi:hypothetical protein
MTLCSASRKAARDTIALRAPVVSHSLYGKSFHLNFLDGSFVANARRAT